jgi:hypothetical protein
MCYGRPAMQPGQTIDRSFVRLITYKRFITAALSYAAAVGLSIATAFHGGAPAIQFAAALVIFVGGGTWALRDGLRLRRELSASSSEPSSAS